MGLDLESLGVNLRGANQSSGKIENGNGSKGILRSRIGNDRSCQTIAWVEEGNQSSRVETWLDLEWWMKKNDSPASEVCLRAK